jgi:ABC-type Fe3+/spermidine/putrescine transport system ATPase subunit
MLRIDDIYKMYEGKPLLRGISFTVQAGETVCLLGRSGSGKSTLLRIIAGIETPERGNVFWNEENLSGMAVHKRKFGFMFQDYALFPHKNVFENVAFGLRMQNLPENEINQRVNSELRKVNLISFANRSVMELSGGEQQRVALARALAPNPRLLMLDEPLGALDRSLKERLMQELRLLLHESGIPAIYVTHDQEEAFTIGDRLILINDGLIIQNDTPTEIYHHPENIWVAQFLGLSNFIEGSVISMDPFMVSTILGKLQTKKPQGREVSLHETVKLLIRPEAAELNFLSESVNTINVSVVDSIFLGANYRVKVRHDDLILDLLLEKPVSKDQNVQLVLNPDLLDCYLKEDW